MTEAEWLTCDDPGQMLSALQISGSLKGDWGQVKVKVSDRKLRLFAAACWRADSPATFSSEWFEALTQLEELADGLRDCFSRPALGYICACLNVENLLRHLSGLWVGENQTADARERNRQRSANLLRDIVGNPFRLVEFFPRSRHILGIAKAIYQERSFEELPVLADAIEDEGAAPPVLLEHLRSPGPHVRGCWAVDLVLGKSPGCSVPADLHF